MKFIANFDTTDEIAGMKELDELSKKYCSKKSSLTKPIKYKVEPNENGLSVIFKTIPKEFNFMISILSPMIIDDQFRDVFQWITFKNLETVN